MAEQLRTLQDLDKQDDMKQVGMIFKREYATRDEDLRDEAKKWIKELKCETVIISNGLASTEEGFESYLIQQVNKSALILWIKYFFNISSLDLEEKQFIKTMS